MLDKNNLNWLFDQTFRYTSDNLVYKPYIQIRSSRHQVTPFKNDDWKDYI